MPVLDLSIPCSLAVRYIVLEYRTKVRSSSTMSHRCVQVGYIKSLNCSFCNSPFLAGKGDFDEKKPL